MLLALVFLAVGLYCLWLGWARLRAPNPRRAPLSLPERAALRLVRWTRDEASALKWQREQLQPARARRMGALYLLAGMAATLAGVLQALAWIEAR